MTVAAKALPHLPKYLSLTICKKLISFSLFGTYSACKTQRRRGVSITSLPPSGRIAFEKFNLNLLVASNNNLINMGDKKFLKHATKDKLRRSLESILFAIAEKIGTQCLFGKFKDGLNYYMTDRNYFQPYKVIFKCNPILIFKCNPILRPVFICV